MSSIRVVILLAAFVFGAAVGAAAGKLTEDPNAPGARPPEKQPKTDARLAQTVTYEAKRATVLNILTELSEKTGVTLKAGQNHKDWHVRSRRMNVFAKDVPLSALMNSIARVMKFKWSREDKDATPSYRLFADRKTWLEAESKRQLEEERIAKLTAERRERLLTRYAEIADLNPQDLEKLKDEDPFGYVVAKSGLAKSMRSFFAEAPELFKALAAGEQFTQSGGALSPAGQQALLRAAQDMDRLESSITGHEGSLADEIAGNISKATIEINPHLGSGNDLPALGFLVGVVEIKCEGRRQAELPIIDPESRISQLMGKVLARCIDEGRRPQELGKDLEPELLSAVTADIKKHDTGEPEPQHPDDLALQARIKLNCESSQLEEVQAALARATGLSVVSDSFGKAFGTVRIREEEAELKAILQKIADGYQYNWEKHGSIIEFRDRHWYTKAAAMVSEDWLEELRASLKKTGTLEINYLAAISELTDEQIRANIDADEVLALSNVSGIVYRSRDLLKLYAGLTDAQRSMLISADGLDLRALTPEQLLLARRLIIRRNGQYFDNPDARIVFAAIRHQTGKTAEYVFRATTSDDLTPIEWKLTPPMYREPPKPDKPKDPAPAGQ